MCVDEMRVGGGDGWCANPRCASIDLQRPDVGSKDISICHRAGDMMRRTAAAIANSKNLQRERRNSRRRAEAS